VRVHLIRMLTVAALAFAIVPAGAAASVELYTVPTPDSPVAAGGARVRVASSLEVTTRIVTDYRHYSQMIPKFDQARIVGKVGKQTDVYLQVPILEGAARVWAVMRMAPPRKVAEGEVLVTGRMVRGNVKRFDLTCRLKRIDADSTQLSLEMLIVPRLPVPAGVVTTGVAKTARYAVKQLRDAAESAPR